LFDYLQKSIYITAMSSRNLSSPNFFDPAILRKSSIIDKGFALVNDSLPLPSIIELSPSGTCNRTCDFCPRSDPAYPIDENFISIDLTSKLANQLNAVNFSGLVMFSGFVEPLLDKNIFEHISLLRTHLSDSRIEMVTNGDVLNEERLQKLFASGLSTLLISVYDSKDDATRFEKMCHLSGLNDDQFVIRHRYLPPEQDFGITMNNRAGMMDSTAHKRPSLSEPLKKPCFYPNYSFFMDYLGDVLLCPHDWGKKMIVGNFYEQDFIEIWFSQLMMINRKKLNQGDRNFKPCNVCDVQGSLMGEKHAEAWGKLHNYNIAK
jgi:radical SAM protein with 4Fe4S-binding SPASM domain